MDRHFLVKKVGKIQLPLQVPDPKTHFQTQEPGLLAETSLWREGIKFYKAAHRKNKLLPPPFALTLCLQPRPQKSSFSHCEIQNGKSYFGGWFYSRNLALGKVLRVSAQERIFLKGIYKSHAWKPRAHMLGAGKYQRQTNPSPLQDLSVLVQNWHNHPPQDRSHLSKRLLEVQGSAWNADVEPHVSNLWECKPSQILIISFPCEPFFLSKILSHPVPLLWKVRSPDWGSSQDYGVNTKLSNVKILSTVPAIRGCYFETVGGNTRGKTSIGNEFQEGIQCYLKQGYTITQTDEQSN